MNNYSNNQRILFVCNSLSGGGAEGRFKQVISYFSDLHPEVAVLNGLSTPIEFQNIVKVHDLGWRSSKSYLKVIFKLWRLIHSGRYDTVMAFANAPCYVSWLCSLGMKRKNKLVFSEITKPKTAISHMRPKAKSYLFHVLSRIIYPRADIFTANSIDGVNEAVQYYGVDVNKTVRLHNIIDPEHIKQRSSEYIVPEKKHGFIRIVIQTRLDAMKDIETVLQAISIADNRKRIELFIIGDGPDKTRLENIACSLQIDEHAVFLGWKSNPYPWLASADLMIQASLWEGFSNAIIEAMALGVKVIATLNTSDVIEMDQIGVVRGFPTGDPITLANLLNQSDSFNENSDICHEYLSRFSIENAILDYKKVLFN